MEVELVADQNIITLLKRYDIKYKILRYRYGGLPEFADVNILNVTYNLIYISISVNDKHKILESNNYDDIVVFLQSIVRAFYRQHLKFVDNGIDIILHCNLQNVQQYHNQYLKDRKNLHENDLRQLILVSVERHDDNPEILDFLWTVLKGETLFSNNIIFDIPDKNMIILKYLLDSGIIKNKTGLMKHSFENNKWTQVDYIIRNGIVTKECANDVIWEKIQKVTSYLDRFNMASEILFIKTILKLQNEGFIELDQADQTKLFFDLCYRGDTDIVKYFLKYSKPTSAMIESALTITKNENLRHLLQSKKID
jgi:hypothetical protein